MNPKKHGIIYLSLLAALVSTLCDKVHVVTETLYYPNPSYGGQAWWVLPGFFLAFTIMGISYLQLVKFLPSSIKRTYSIGNTPANYNSFIESMLLFTFIYILSGFGNESPLFLNLLIYGTFLLRLIVTRERVFILILSISIGLGGTLAEGILSALDLVYYTKPVFFHVPIWLAGLYLHGAFALRECMRFFVYNSNKPL